MFEGEDETHAAVSRSEFEVRVTPNAHTLRHIVHVVYSMCVLCLVCGTSQLTNAFNMVGDEPECMGQRTTWIQRRQTACDHVCRTHQAVHQYAMRPCGTSRPPGTNRTDPHLLPDHL